ncbi:MAG: hypothetical protein GFH25_541276n31 [Chloroflexi bacterium AL-N10]|nr:hypothetical protein [Chloroflexi bacterium AL-N1]NOK71112.1 hypothetical protein [Chloroflexi bacterium AL-N10]NOK77360.1 hypothetical protein [Chloroflexi bacterium AL-N5]
MTTDTHSSIHSRPNSRTSIGAVLLLSPATICCFLTLFVPTIRTLLLSMQNADLFGTSTFVGWENYARLFQDPIFWSAIGFSLTHVVIRVIVVSIVPLLLALALSRFGRTIRLSTRLLFTIPLAAFAPIFAALMWRIWFSNPATQSTGIEMPLVNVDVVRPTLFLIDSLSIFGVVCGVGLIVYSMALRGLGNEAPSAQQVRMPLLITWFVSVVATIALALQEFTLSFVLTRGGPDGATTSLSFLQFELAFIRFAFGEGAVVASLMLAILTMLGIIVGVIIAMTGVQIKMAPPNRSGAATNRGLAGVTLGLLLFLSIGCWFISIFPPIINLLTPSPGQSDAGQVFAAFPVATLLINTIVPTTIGVFVQLAMAYLGALGIGALRPLGKRSEWLLVLFSPWLFVTTIPMSLIAFQDRLNVELLNSMLGLVSPILISIPALFILTLFFKGQHETWQEAQVHGQKTTFTQAIIKPSLPLTVLLGSVGLLVGMQSFYWPLLVSTNPSAMPILVFVVSSAISNPFGWAEIPILLISLGLPFWIFFLIIFSLFQLFYIDRLTFVTNRRTS